jgi:hypothetical protein
MDGVEKAVRFLRSTNGDGVGAARNTAEKRQFLLDKGLSEEQVDEAFQIVNSGNAPPPVPSFTMAMIRVALARTKQWLFLMLLAGGTVFYHYRRTLLVPVLFILYTHLNLNRS